jgi:hypothetical protein
MLGMLGNMLGKNVRLLGKWLGNDVRKIRANNRRPGERKNPGKPGKKPGKPDNAKLPSFGEGVNDEFNHNQDFIHAWSM